MKKAVSIAEAKDIVGVSRTRIYQEIKAGKLLIRKVGRRTLIELDELDRWLDNLPR